MLATHFELCLSPAHVTAYRMLAFAVVYVAWLFNFANFLVVQRFYCLLIEAYRLVTADSIRPSLL